MHQKIALAILLASISLSCQSDNQIQEPQQPQKQLTTKTANTENSPTTTMSHHQTKTWQQATVKYLTFEGGFYGLITSDGQRLLPLRLAKEFRQDGAIVKVTGQFKPDVITIKQWGTPFEIEEIILIKAGREKVQSQ